MLRSLTLMIVVGSTLASAADCTYRLNPDLFRGAHQRSVSATYERTLQAAKLLPGAKASALASEAPPRSFIDEEIFGKLAAANVPSASLATDEEFLRRVTLDLTGRLPAPSDIRAFLADDSTTKRDAVIDRLLASPAFNDRWTIWLGDLLENASFPALFDRREEGVTAYQSYLKNFMARGSGFRDLAFELVTGSGNHFDASAGAANFPITGKTNMGPSQDTYDNMLVKSSTMFLGMSQYDCLLCHNGRGHLDQVNLWGAGKTRLEAQRMAAFFSRLNMPSRNVPTNDFYHYSYDISDKTTGTYDLNTNNGNRPNRTPVGDVKSLTPVFRETGDMPADANWRKSFANSVWRDPMFSRNFANRLWREMFGMGLAEPFDMLDPDRLDPANPPPAPWTLQATHPVLLEKLAGSFSNSDFNLRSFLRLLVQSNAYQMSSRYDGPWTLDSVPLFARHYPRRLMAEEIHDALVLATGIPGSYRIKNWTNPVTLAMQLPEPAEPRSDGNTASFLNSFLRGNRDSQPRTQNLSILQRLNIMNDAFVLNRLKIPGSPVLQTIAKMPDDAAVVDEVFLLFLARMPRDAEKQNALTYLGKAQNTADRNGLIEDLAWVCVSKAEFLFSY